MSGPLGRPGLPVRSLARGARQGLVPAAAALALAVLPAAPLGAQDASSAAPGAGAWANYDFVPGGRVLFADDFTRDRVGNFPQRLEMLNGNMEVVEWQGRRWLRVTDYGAFQIPLPEKLPERFTVEFEVTLPWNRVAFYSHEYPNADGVSTSAPNALALLSGHEVGVFRSTTRSPPTAAWPRAASSSTPAATASARRARPR